MSKFVTKVEMIGARVIEVQCQFYQAQSEHVGKKAQVPLWVAGDGRYVVNFRDFFAHSYFNAF